MENNIERKIYYYSLALENYEDYTHNYSESLHNTWDKLSYLRKNNDTLSVKEKEILKNEILKSFEQEVVKIGKDKFNIDEDGYVVSKDGQHKYDFNDADVVAEIPLDKIDVVDDIESDECEVVGEIVDLIYVGDHYRYILRTENEEDFVFVSTYSYNLNDTIGLKVKKEDIKLRLKKEVTEYEI